MGSFFGLEQLPKDRLPHIAFAGRSNVGKSTMLNRIVGQRKMAKVSGTPGKTRSLNFFLVNERFYLVDLPGYGYAKVAKSVKETWGKLVGDYMESCQDLIGLILLLDCRREPNAEDERLIAWLADKGLPALAVVTKMDKLGRNKGNQKVQEIEKRYQMPTLPFSSLSGVGRKELARSILDLVGQKPNS